MKNNCKCTICGYSSLTKYDKYFKCEACGAVFDLEAIDSEFNNDYAEAIKWLEDTIPNFEMAYSRFNSLVEKYPTKSEGYWGRLLSKYGIKFEYDSGKSIPSCYYETYEDIRNSDDYKKVLKYASSDLKKKYEDEALRIADVVKVWLETASKLNYDAFISYKATDEDTRQSTKDLSDMRNLYNYLTDRGYRVFFSQVSLNEIGIHGRACEPYVFNAILKAKIMIVYGSKPEYFISQWVSNEWRRYLMEIERGNKKDISLIAAYKDFDVKELPNELAKRHTVIANSPSFYSEILGVIDECLNEEKIPTLSLNSNKKDNTFRRKDELKSKQEKINNLIQNANTIIYDCNRWVKLYEAFKEEHLSTISSYDREIAEFEALLKNNADQIDVDDLKIFDNIVEVKELDKKVASCKNRLTNYEKYNRFISSDVLDMIAEIDKVIKELTKINHKQCEIKENNKKLKEHITKMQEENKDTNKLINDKNEQISSERNSIARYNNVIGKYSNMITMVKAMIDYFNNKIEDYNQKILSCDDALMN